MSFRNLVKYALNTNNIGWYATRQQMIKQGASLHDVAHVLVFRLGMIAQQEAK